MCKTQTKLGLWKLSINSKNFDHRKSLSKLRISCHRLQIEVGRFTNIPRENRLSNRCNSNSTDDETHFLITCEKYNHQRNLYL